MLRARMFSGLTQSVRLKAAIALSFLYACCVIAPAATLALSGGEASAHCFDEPHGHAGAHQYAQIHKHANGSVHAHDQGEAPDHSSDDKAQGGKCCGLFCVTALVSASVPELGKPALASTLFPAVDTGLASRGPDRINRPPIA
jgi:hypothetical protein